MTAATAPTESSSRYQRLYDFFARHPTRIFHVREVREQLPALCDPSFYPVVMRAAVVEHRFLVNERRGFYRLAKGATRPAARGWSDEKKAALSAKLTEDALERDRRVIHLTPGAAPVAIDPILSAPLVRRVDRCAHR